MTKQNVSDNVAKNNIIDRALMGVGAFVLVMAAGHGIMPYIKAAEPVNYLLTGAAVSALMYMVLAPMFRK